MMEVYSSILRFLGLAAAIILYICGMRKKDIPIKYIFLLPRDKDQIHLAMRCFEIPTLILTITTLSFYLYTGEWLIDPEGGWIITLLIALFFEISEYLLEIDVFRKEELDNRGIKV